ncbi:MAG: YARHG domain-containing protein [Filifactoraceae bacterium]
MKLNNLLDDKQKAHRIYGAICEDFDSGHYSSCVNLIKKHRELLSSFLSQSQDEKIYKIYAFSIFTLIEDNYLAGNIDSANNLLKSYESLLENHLPHDAKKSLEGYKTGNIPKIGSDVLKPNEDNSNNEIEHTKLAWTITDNDFTSVLKDSDKENEPEPKNKKSNLGNIFSIFSMVIILVCGIFFAFPMIEDIANKVINRSDSATTEPKIPAKEDSNLTVVDPPKTPPIETAPQVEIPLDPNSLISPNVKVNSDGYVLPSNSRLIGYEDLEGFDQKMVRLATNEMFARKGFAFSNTGDYYNFFCQFSWYEPNPDITIDQAESMFSETEKSNLLTLLNFNS